MTDLVRENTWLGSVLKSMRLDYKKKRDVFLLHKHKVAVDIAVSHGAQLLFQQVEEKYPSWKLLRLDPDEIGQLEKVKALINLAIQGRYWGEPFSDYTHKPRTGWRPQGNTKKAVAMLKGRR